MWRSLGWGLLLGFPLLSCGDTTDSSADQAAAPMCFAEPKTHLEIINSCADPPGIDKPARLAKFRPGAQLQPLP
jgi:hypothetical protein